MNRDGTAIPMIVRGAGPEWLVRANGPFVQRVGFDSDELREQPLLEWIESADRAELQAALERGEGRVVARHVARHAEPLAVTWEVATDQGEPRVLGLVEASPRPPVSRLGTLGAASMRSALEEIVHVVEDMNEGLFCSVLLLDESGLRVSLGAGPSLPDEYNGAVEGLAIGPGVGSCGTAAFWDVRVLVEDIRRDPFWRDLREHAVAAGLAACWSQPLRARSGEVLGALALYATEPRRPTAVELDHLDMAARLTGIAIERARAEYALRESEATAQVQSRLLREVTAAVTAFVDTGDGYTAGRRLVRAAMELTDSRAGLLAVLRDGEVETLCGEALEGAMADEAAALARETIAGCAPVATARPGGCSRLGVPIHDAREPLGMIGVLASPHEYTAEDLRQIDLLCRAACALLDSQRRRERESSLEQQLHLAAKMEALGVLAGGIAHDFNNMLATVLGNAEMAMATLPDDSDAQRLLGGIVAASDRAAQFCDQMLAYAGSGTLATETVELNHTIRELAQLLSVALSKKARIEYELHPEPLHVRADESRLDQVLMNLITNAGEAIGDEPGTIRVATRPFRGTREALDELRPGADLAEGPYVELTVSDTGCGMDADTQSRIFDPFFTTKFAGRGLGLAAAKGVLESHGGAIGLESAPGEGTTFTLVLPRAEVATEHPAPRPDALDPSSGRRVLVVDDEPEVRAIQGSILEHAGYEVLLAEDGQAAIDLFRERGHEIDCVLLDLSMPRLDGEETFRALRELRADLPVVLSSGYTEREVIQRVRGAGFAGVLQKPTPRDRLLRMIASVTA